MRSDWRHQVAEFVHEQGHDDLWDYLRAHPGVSLVAVAKQIGAVIPVQLEGLVMQECLARRQLGQLVRDLLARRIAALPEGWSAANRSSRKAALWLHLREPYRSLIAHVGQALLETAPPPDGWSPTSGDDPHLVRVYDQALALLPPYHRQMIDRGELERDPGDAYWAALEPHFEAVSIYDGPARFAEQFAALPRPMGHLLATHWCQSEVVNGGLLQLFANATGVLAPEAVAGFSAIGMPRCAALLTEAMRQLGEPYPRDRQPRTRRLEQLTRQGAEPFDALDEELDQRLSLEAGGFATAADTYYYREIDED